MTLDELKLRQMTNQHLTDPADKITVVRDLCGIQAQFMSNALHSLKIRTTDDSDDVVERGLIKTWMVRGTIHVVVEDDLPLYLCSNNAHAYRSDDWTIPSFWNQRADWALTPQRQAELSACILNALRTGVHTREELKHICREHGMNDAEEGSMFHPWGGGIRELCERGFMHGLAQEDKVYVLSPVYKPIPEADAKLELARRYFTHIAPATIHDAMYFFHTTATQVKRWLNDLPVTSTQVQDKTYFYIDNDISLSENLPCCLFLAGFDQLLLGYEKKESLYLAPEDMRRIFNLAGTVMPAVLLNGQVAGRWKKKNHKLIVDLFKTVTKQDEDFIRETAFTLWNTTLAAGNIQINHLA